MRTDVQKIEGPYSVFSASTWLELASMDYHWAGVGEIPTWIRDVSALMPLCDIKQIFIGHLDFCENQYLKNMLTDIPGPFYIVYTIRRKEAVTLLNIDFEPLIYN